ncbi:MAG: nuclear transport factor 2 family protein [Kofleriaceae bacterium]
MRTWWLVMLATATVAQAQNPQAAKPKAKLDELLGQLVTGNPPDLEPAKLVFREHEVITAPTLHSLTNGYRPDKLVIATGANKSIAWTAMDLTAISECIEAPLPKDAMGDPIMCVKGKTFMIDGIPHVATGQVRHATGLFEKTATTWRPIVWHQASPIADKELAQAIKTTVLDKLPRTIDGAEAVVAQFQATIGKSATLAATISDRSDVVMYGSQQTERYVGGAAVKKQLGAWNLTFAVRDGIVAGLAGTSVAWVAANVNATAGKSTVPYRLLAIYEQTAGVWKIVQLHFSFPNYQ